MLAILDIIKNGQPNDTGNTKRLLRDTLVEFIATALFVFNGTLSAASTGVKEVGSGQTSDVARVLPIAMSFGISIMTLAYAIGHITGGHMNPGVTLLMFFRRQVSAKKMALYWIAQLIGALVGASLTWGCISELAGETVVIGDFEHEFNRPPFMLGSTTVSDAISTGNAFLLEFMGSFFFYFIIAQTALDKRGVATTAFPAIPIGFSLVVVHVCLIPYTGCGVNPARTFGPSMVTCMAGGNCDGAVGSWYWVYYVAPFLASWAVAEVTMLMDMDVDGNEEVTFKGTPPAEEEVLKEAANVVMEQPSSEDQA